jgi:cytochrome P450
MSRRAPGPRGDRLVGHVRPFRHDALALLVESQRRYGDIVRFRLGPTIVHLLAHPDHIRAVLVDRQPNYDKDTRSARQISRVTGSGLLTSNGATWLRKRRLMQPAFHARRVASFVEIMTRATTETLDAWQGPARTGEPVDVQSSMTRLTCSIVARALFGADVKSDLSMIERAATEVMSATYRGIERIVPVPSWLPTRPNAKFRRALGDLNALVSRIVDDRRLRSGHDLISLLAEATDEDGGPGLTRDEICDETLTLLLAGHETTANALTWTLALLAEHRPEALAVRGEVAQELAGRAPTAVDLGQLPRTACVIREAMRLYPPIWIMERRVREDDEIDGFELPAGSMVVLCPYVTHRHPAFWIDVDRFDPSRFEETQASARHPHAYIPFGAGQRLCIGAPFAMAEAQVILAMVLQRFTFERSEPVPLVPQPGITLRCRGGLPMRLHPVAGVRS